MKANDLTALLDKGYADGAGLIAAHGEEAEATEQGINPPRSDMLAYYLASWVRDHQLAGWFTAPGEKSDLHVYASFLTELDLAIQDLDTLYKFVQKVVLYDEAIKFFTFAATTSRRVTPDLLAIWLDVAAEGEDLGFCATELEILIFNHAVIGTNPGSERCAEIIAGLEAEKAALLADRKEVPAVAESEAPAPAAPETVK